GEEVAQRLLRPFQLFARQAVSGGIVLFLFTIVALVWANSPWAEAYQRLVHQPFGLHLGEHGIAFDLHHWINDGLMAIFFFVVGLEIKRELLVGELAEPGKALLPIGAAVGGMLGPAMVYLAFNARLPTAGGWGIPMATDIAFALGVLALLGSRVPSALGIFLVALAIVDDLGAVLVIALFYASSLNWAGLGLAAAFLAAMVAANRGGFRHAAIYLCLGIGLWYGFLISGVHATLAGVVAALTVPARVRIPPRLLAQVVRRAADRLEALEGEGDMDSRRFAVVSFLQTVTQDAKTPLQRFEHMAHPWVAFVIMPGFALVNAGIAIDRGALAALLDPLPLGIAAGLVVGKQVGVVGATWLLVRTGAARLPQGVSWGHIYGVAWLTGIGFTMSLFISGLAFPAADLGQQAKLGILLGSVVSALGGVVILTSVKSERPVDPAPREHSPLMPHSDPSGTSPVDSEG
ncbi:MAG TPA: Na+/H+ antiporter NhaA, partial [Methylomirabilota bacterium]|nr:Na+/H+ antiporter NhaA [Methylomirabilota bacterium]